MVISPDSKSPFSHKTRNIALKKTSGGGRQASGKRDQLIWRYLRSIFLAMKNKLAGRSPSLRMKYGYHSVPKGT